MKRRNIYYIYYNRLTNRVLAFPIVSTDVPCIVAGSQADLISLPLNHTLIESETFTGKTLPFASKIEMGVRLVPVNQSFLNKRLPFSTIVNTLPHCVSL